MREYTRRHQRQEDHAREALGSLGAVLSRVTDEPASTKVWRRAPTARSGQLTGSPSTSPAEHSPAARPTDPRPWPRQHRPSGDRSRRCHRDRHQDPSRPSPGRAYRRLFSPRRSALLINGRDQTKLIDAIERQIELVRSALTCHRPSTPEIRGALCFRGVDGLPVLRQLSAREIITDGPKPVAELASRPGPLTHGDVDRLWHELGRLFPPA